MLNENLVEDWWDKQVLIGSFRIQIEVAREHSRQIRQNRERERPGRIVRVEHNALI